MTQQAVNVFVHNADVVEFVFWLDAHNVDAISLLNNIFSLLGLDLIEVRSIDITNKASCGGWKGLHDKILNVVDVHAIGTLITKLSKSDKEFSEMIKILQGSQQLLQGLVSTPEVKKFLSALESHGVDIIAIRDIIRLFFGWSY